MTGPAAPIVSGESFGKGGLLSIDSNLPYRDANPARVLWSYSQGFTTAIGSVSVSLYAPRFYVRASSWTAARTVYCRVVLIGQGGDDDSPPSNEVSFAVDPAASDPPVPDGPALTLAGERTGVRVRLGGLAQDAGGPDFQNACLSWREPPGTITQTLWQIGPSSVTTLTWSGGTLPLYRYAHHADKWVRTKTGDAAWTAWSARERLDLHASSEIPETRDFNAAMLTATNDVIAAVGFNALLYEHASGQFSDGSLNPPTTLPNLLRRVFDFEPSDFVPDQASRLNNRALGGVLVFRSRFGNHYYNVILASDNSTWWLDALGVQVGQTQAWSVRNAALPDEVSLQQPADDLRPGRTGLLVDNAMRLVTAASLGTAAPADFNASRWGVLRVTEDTPWGALQCVTAAEYRIDMLTDGTEYDVAASVTSWTQGPFTRGRVTAGGVAGTPPVVHPPQPAIGYDNIVLPIRVDSGRFVSSVTLTDGGSGYTEAPAVRFSAGLDRRDASGRVIQGRAARATATVAGGAVTEVEVTDGGQGYGDFVPEVWFEGGGGSGASAVAVVGEHEPVDSMAMEYRETTLVGQMNAPWRKLRDGWRGDQLEKSGFGHGTVIDVRITAKSASGSSSATTSGLVVGYTPEGREIMPGWLDRDPGGLKSLYRVFASLVESEAGTKLWTAGSVDRVVDADLEQRLSDGVRRIRGVWTVGAQYNFGDIAFRYANVRIGGSSFRGLATFLALKPHLSSQVNRPPNALANQWWVMESPPQELGGTAPSPPPAGDSADRPPEYRVRLTYNRCVSEAHGGVVPRNRGEYKFGSGGNRAYEPANLDWAAVMRHTVLAVAPQAVRVNLLSDDATPDEVGASAALIWESLIYGVSEGNPDNDFDERIAVVFADDRWLESKVVGARISANIERYVVQSEPSSKNESGGTEDLELDTEVELRVSLKELIEDNRVSNAALPLAATGLGVAVTGSSVAATWTLPALGATTRTGVLVSLRAQDDLRFGSVQALSADATSHTFEQVASGTYDLFVRTLNDAGGTTALLADQTVP